MLKVFLDLEETIIDSWSNPVLVNHWAIKNFLKDRWSEIGTHEPINDIGIFSFAIHDEEDRRLFVIRNIKDVIETALEVTITNILTVPEIIKEVFWKRGIHADVNEFISLWGKQRAFIDWAFVTQSDDTHLILIDDTVQISLS